MTPSPPPLRRHQHRHRRHQQSPPSRTGTSNITPLAMITFTAVLLTITALSSISPASAAPAATCTVDEHGQEECFPSSDSFVKEGPCEDRHPQCKTWSLTDVESCTDSRAAYMSYYCPKSCGTCAAVVLANAMMGGDGGGEDVVPCRDDAFECSKWAATGECEANPGYVQKNCRSACGLCFEATNQFGVGQRLPKENPAYTTPTKTRIQESIDYMSRVGTDDALATVRHKCRNDHEDCTYWSAQGECDANPHYMRTNCAPACQTCHLLDVRTRCPVLPGNDPVWGPGDLNELFENIVDDADGSGRYKKYDPVALSRPAVRRDGTPAPNVEKDGPWVVVLENFIAEEEADRLIEHGTMAGYERSADVGKEKADGSHDSLFSESRTSHNSWCVEEKCFADPLVVPLIDRLANSTGTHHNNSEYLQLLRYEPGQYYRMHHDYIGHHRDMPCGARILTFFLYLNDVEEGGGTRFPTLDITVQPKKGRALLWPSVLDSSPHDIDMRTQHEALPVEKGIKYGANAWIHMRNFKEAYKNHCH